MVGGDTWLCLDGVWWLSMGQGFYCDCWRIEGVGDYWCGMFNLVHGFGGGGGGVRFVAEV